MKKHPELFKVERKVAFASCWFEFFDLLEKILCKDARTLSYFLTHDLKENPPRD